MSVRDRATMSGEFPKSPPGQALRDRLEAGRRIAQSCVTNVFGDSANNAAMATSLGTVLAIGVYEGALLTRPGALGRARFCFRYGAAQVLPSVIWLTKPARTCCEAWRVEAKPLLREVSPRRELKVLGAQTLRSIVAGFLGIAQVMRLVDSSAAAASDYDERVRNGHEPLFETGVQERVVRLAGRESDVTELSVRRFGAHIVPVFEDFSLPSVRRTLAAARTAGSGVDTPFGWHVPDGAYSKMESWGVPPPTVDRDGDGTADYDLSRAAFRVKREWLLPNGPNRRALVVEADSSVGEQALALGAEGADDLTLQECSQGFRLVERLATEQKALQADDAVIRVMLADASRQIRSGGGAAMSLRALVEEHDEADIIIDASAPLIHSIVAWAETTGSGRYLLFKTENSEYYASVRSSLKARGWRVADFEGASTKQRKSLPVLVYEETTEDSVNSIESLLRKNEVNSSMVCALLDSVSGVDELRRLGSRLPPARSVSHVCSAEIYCDCFTRVRHAIRAGTPTQTIQRELDDAFAPH
ncbi:unnamed protein product [Pelagomonas calceolata]|uniref:Uncharacterized protein n=1 Tax=Pelagomonas calceolata TaxID=35677 RepID=A0A8J2SRQ5_9STRA|nr:unnamed protein product [Pelagomonas calceolata]